MDHRRILQSGCFVIDQSDLVLETHGSIRWAQVIGADDPSQKLSLFYLEAHMGISPDISLGGSESVLYLQQGQGFVSICGEQFAAHAGSGVHVRAGEQFSVINDSGDVALWLVSICPQVEKLNFASQETGKFDHDFPERVVSGTDSRMQATGDRFYKLLVGPGTGSGAVTQFIGRIPPSKAPEHYHLYEEAICILSGHGRLWNGDLHTPVRPGSMIFLPSKQPHCLECLDAKGMELMGVFYPAGSPAINYRTRASQTG